ncbi:MAG: hypothetical protein IMY75_04545 [Chloroflexi bacterium]|nr:hypothetical protein [Chloroflexota bacterium]
MTKSRKQGRRKKKRRFETAGTLILGRARVGRSSKIRHSRFALRYLLLLSLVTMVAGALWLALDDRFYVYHANVVGAVRVSPDEVFRASGLPGLHILWARSAEIEARVLTALPTLESAQAVCGLQPLAPGAGLPAASCTITVVERQPRVMWDEDGQLWWIDDAGVIFSAQGTLSEGWLVRGPLPRDDDGRLDERVRIGLAELWTSGADVSPPFTYVPGRGLVFTDERGWRVIVGQGPGMAMRLQVLEWLAADLEARGLTPRFVDVRFSDAPYYSLTNDW